MNAQSPTCFGCYVNWPWLQATPVPFQVQPPPSTQSHYLEPAEGLTEEEKEILKLLSEVWAKFIVLDSKHLDDDPDMRRAIHDGQKLIALRVARRIDKEIWAI